MIQKWLGHSQPWLYMSAYFERHKDKYITGLYRISSQADWSGWVAFCLRGVVVQANDSILRCREFNTLRADFHKRVRTPSPRTHKIIEGLFISPFVSIADLALKLQVTYPTADADIKRLVEAKILTELPDVHAKTFFCKAIVQIAYSDRVEV